MSRSDLEALVRDYYGNPLAEPYKPFGAVDLAHTVATHERARIVALLRDRADRCDPEVYAPDVLRGLADELEADT